MSFDTHEVLGLLEEQPETWHAWMKIAKDVMDADADEERDNADIIGEKLEDELRDAWAKLPSKTFAEALFCLFLERSISNVDWPSVARKLIQDVKQEQRLHGENSV